MDEVNLTIALIEALNEYHSYKLVFDAKGETDESFASSLYSLIGVGLDHRAKTIVIMIA